MTTRTRHATRAGTQPDASTSRTAREAAALQADPQLALLHAYLKQLRLPAIARECVPLAREAEQQGVGFLGYLQTLVEQEVTQRHEHQLRANRTSREFLGGILGHLNTIIDLLDSSGSLANRRDLIVIAGDATLLGATSPSIWLSRRLHAAQSRSMAKLRDLGRHVRRRRGGDQLLESPSRVPIGFSWDCLVQGRVEWLTAEDGLQGSQERHPLLA